jgi:predicted transposase YbfD/YdcC
MCGEAGILELFELIEDPRREQAKRHRLPKVLFMLLFGQAMGAETLEEVVTYCEGRLEWIEQYVNTDGGVPSERTFGRVLQMLDPELLPDLYTKVLGELDDKPHHIAIDGKVGRGVGAIRTLHAYECNDKKLLGSVLIDHGRGERSAIPKLLHLLDLKGNVVSMDAGFCYAPLLEEVLARGGDYIVALKGNQKGWQEEAEQVISMAKPVSAVVTDTRHGRTTEVVVKAYPTDNIMEAPGVKTLVSIDTCRLRGHEIQEEVRWFITSLTATPESLADLVRNHWAIENNLHGTLDLFLGDDRCRHRDRVAAANRSFLRKLVLLGFERYRLHLPKKTFRSLRASISTSSNHWKQYVQGFFE